MPAKQAFPKVRSDNVFGQARKSAKMFRAGLYARVSTNDQQTLPMQSRAMREYAARRGWTITVQVREVGSGAAKREAREKLLEAARRREIDVVLVWRLDRWGRSVTDLLATLQELEHLGVGFVSLTEALDLTTPAGRAMAGLLAVFAAFEREILGERTRLDWPTPGRTANVWAGPQRQPRTRPRSGDYIALASPKRRSPAGSWSGALRYAESWAIPPGNRSANLLTQAHRKDTDGPPGMDVAKGFDGVALSDDNDLVVGKTVGNGTEILALDRTTRSWVPVPLPDHKAGTWLAVFGFDGTTLVTSPAHGTLRRFKLTEDVPGKE